jgi:hypothetical protein
LARVLAFLVLVDVVRTAIGVDWSCRLLVA